MPMYNGSDVGAGKPTSDLIIISLLRLQTTMNGCQIDQPTQAKIIEVLKKGKLGEINLPNHSLVSSDAGPRDIH